MSGDPCDDWVGDVTQDFLEFLIRYEWTGMSEVRLKQYVSSDSEACNHNEDSWLRWN